MRPLARHAWYRLPRELRTRVGDVFVSPLRIAVALIPGSVTLVAAWLLRDVSPWQGMDAHALGIGVPVLACVASVALIALALAEGPKASSSRTGLRVTITATTIDAHTRSAELDEVMRASRPPRATRIPS